MGLHTLSPIPPPHPTPLPPPMGTPELRESFSHLNQHLGLPTITLDMESIWMQVPCMCLIYPDLALVTRCPADMDFLNSSLLEKCNSTMEVTPIQLLTRLCIDKYQIQTKPNFQAI